MKNYYWDTRMIRSLWKSDLLTLEVGFAPFGENWTKKICIEMLCQWPAGNQNVVQVGEDETNYSWIFTVLRGAYKMNNQSIHQSIYLYECQD